MVYITKQVSHPLPVSAYFATCPQRSLQLFSINQISVSATVSGMTLRVSRSIITGGFGEGEGYHFTHPIVSVNGIYRGRSCSRRCGIRKRLRDRISSITMSQSDAADKSIRRTGGNSKSEILCTCSLCTFFLFLCAGCSSPQCTHQPFAT